MAIRGKFALQGINEYLKRVQEAGNNIDDVAAKAVVTGARVITKKGLGSGGNEGIEGWARRHKLTGATIAGVIQPVAKREGNYIYAEFGISGAGESSDAVYVEYGHPGFSADPGIRRSVEQNSPLARKMMKMVYDEGGNVNV